MFATTVPFAANSLEILEMMTPGPELAAALDGLDRDSLSAGEQLSVMIAHQRLASHYAGQVYRDIAAVESHLRREGDQHHEVIENTAAEIGAALSLTRRSAESETHLALALTRRIPQVHQALLRGDIDVRRARVLARGTEHLSVAGAREVIDSIIDEAPRLTTGQLAGRLRRRCIETDPDAAELRYRRTLEDRRVYANPTPDGAADLLALNLPPDRVAAFTRYLDKAARRLRGRGEKRTMDQLRSDIYLDILLGTHQWTHNPDGGGVHIETDLTTLAHLDDNPGQLAGFGPVVADIARQVTDRQHGAQWTFTVTDPETGDIVCTGTTRRRPTRTQRRRIGARYRTCIWPGCRMPEINCDMDHTTPRIDGGCTHDHNLAPVCRYHHRIRHQAPWSYQRLPNGDHQWTTQLGRTYTTSGRSP